MYVFKQGAVITQKAWERALVCLCTEKYNSWGEISIALKKKKIYIDEPFIALLGMRGLEMKGYLKATLGRTSVNMILYKPSCTVNASSAYVTCTMCFLLCELNQNKKGELHAWEVFLYCPILVCMGSVWFASLTKLVEEFEWCYSSVRAT